MGALGRFGDWRGEVRAVVCFSGVGVHLLKRSWMACIMNLCFLSAWRDNLKTWGGRAGILTSTFVQVDTI